MERFIPFILVFVIILVLGTVSRKKGRAQQYDERQLWIRGNAYRAAFFAAAALLHVSGTSMGIFSPVRMSIAAGLAHGRGQERGVYVLLLPFALAAFGILTVLLTMLGRLSPHVLWRRSRVRRCWTPARPLAGRPRCSVK